MTVEKALRARDWILTPITLTSANNTIRINETYVGGAGAIDVSIPAGRYFLHNSTHATYAGLYKALGTAIAASSLVSTYTQAATSPTLSPYQYGHGWMITGSNPGFEVEWDHPSTTIDPRLFGFDPDESTITADGAGSVRSKKCLRGNWRSETIGQDGIASLKYAKPWKDVRESHKRAQDKVVTRWDAQEYVSFSYESVPAAHVLEAMAYLPLYADNAQLGLEDDHNAFAIAWDAMTDGAICLCVYDLDIYDLTLDSGAFAFKLNDVDSAGDFANIARLVRLAGGFHDIRFTVSSLGAV